MSHLSHVRTAFTAVTVLLSAVALGLGLLVAPRDRFQGDAQRLLYPHVGTAWAAYVCFGLVAVGSLLVLARRSLLWHRVAGAAAEVGAGLTALTLVLGSLWAKPTWGTFWTWDPRLVSTAALLLIYLGYLGARDLTDDEMVSARRSAVLGVLALAVVPVVHFSTVWWRTVHQPPGVLRPGGAQGSMPAEMLSVLLLTTLALTLLALALVWERTAALQARAVTVDGAGANPVSESPLIHVRTRGGDLR